MSPAGALRENAAVRLTNLGFAFACLAAWPAACAQQPQPAASTTYDPLALPAKTAAASLTLALQDQKRNRELPLRVFLPADTGAVPVILFSHGLGGTRDTCNYLGQHWSGRGYAVVFVQHPGSDDSVWKDLPVRGRMAAMEKAASGENLVLRCGDVHTVLDQLALWNAQADHPLHGRLDLGHVGMAGHSFGAVTTQAVGGQSLPLTGQQFTDARIRAALALSPSSPRAGNAGRAFAKVTIPWCLMTGTEDIAPIGGQDVASRLAVFPALPATIDRYELVLHGAEHSAFTERALPGDRGKRNPNHHRAILAISTAFWDAHLRGDSAARAWLHGAGAKSVLEEQDRWQLASGAKAK
jgi:predicted dienelactone hydrolase